MCLLRIVEKECLKLQKKKIATNFIKVREIAKEVADDLVIAYGAEIYYTLDVLEKLEKQAYSYS